VNRVIEIVGLHNLYPGIEKMRQKDMTLQQAAIKAFERDFSVNNFGGTLIHITFSHQDPHIAAKVVNTATEVFKDKHLEVFSGKSSGFLDVQERIFRGRLAASERTLAGFKDRNQVFSFEEQRSALIGQHTTFDNVLKSLHSQMEELQQKIAIIASPRWRPEIPQEMKAQLARLEQKEMELLEKYNQTSRPVAEVREQIQGVRNSISKQSEEIQQTELTKAEADLSIVKAKAESVASQIQQIQSDIRLLDSRGRELQALKREVSEEEQNHQTYARKLEESHILDDMDRRKMVAVSVVEKAVPASLLPKKQKFNKAKMIVAGILGGGAAGVCLAFLLELMSPGLTTPTSAERRLGVPVMVAIAKK
jgi:uncharacterized protein involved in exopolysaccharide biosynthesis